MVKKFLKLLFLLLLVTAAVAVVSFGLVPFSFTGSLIGKEEVGKNIENLYELVNPGVDVTVEKIDDASGMYKVLIKAVDAAGGATFREAYVTKDGALMSESMVLVSQSIGQINKVRDFADCLENKGLVVFGLSNDTPTTLQFNILGGTYATKIYRSCDGSQLQQCVDAGITQVPTAVYEGRGHAGVQPISFFENLTACKF